MEYLCRSSSVPSLFTLKRLRSEVSYVTVALPNVAKFLGTLSVLSDHILFLLSCLFLPFSYLYHYLLPFITT